MAASNILAKFGSRTTLTIDLAPSGTGLASSTVGVGRVSTLVDNTSDKFTLIKLWVSIKLGTSPVAGTGVFIYLVQSNGTEITDGASVTDAAHTVVNAKLIGTLSVKSSPSTGDQLTDCFDIPDPGPKWSIVIVQNTQAALNNTSGNHVLAYVGVTSEAQ